MSKEKTAKLSNEIVIPDNYFAALDIGSNSFHFVHGRMIDQHLQILHSEKYRVALAKGLDKNDNLNQEAIDRGLNTLKNLSALVRNLNPDNFHIVATYTLRKAKNANDFLKAAKKVFPFPIEVISGEEEARLIYKGVAHDFQPKNNHVVIDIGGGSTEIVIGESFEVKTLSSLEMGCVSFSQQFFSDNKINNTNFDNAIAAAKTKLSPVIDSFLSIGWINATGTSGTIKSITHLISLTEDLDVKFQGISLDQLYRLKTLLLSFNTFDELDLKGLKENRRDVICAGLAILIGVMEALSIEQLKFCHSALREGVVYGLAEQLALTNESVNGELSNEELPNDIRQTTVNSLIDRFIIDTAQSNNVKKFALTLYSACAKKWQLSTIQYKKIFTWAAELHEVGMNINPSNYQKHGQYIIENSDLSGFNNEQHLALAWLVGNQIKKISPLPAEIDAPEKIIILEKLCSLLRLAVLLNQQRQLSASPRPMLTVTKSSIAFSFKPDWLEERPAIYQGLKLEAEILESIGIDLLIS